MSSAIIDGLRVAMLGTTDGGFIEGESEIPAGEMFRLASEYLESLAAGYVVLAKREDDRAGGDTLYSPVSSVWATIEPCENHAGWCAAKAEAEPERYGGVEYVVAALSICGSAE